MANTIRIKRRSASAAAPTTTQLVNGELAFNESNDILYYGKGINGANSNEIIKIGGSGAYLTFDTNQTPTGVKTFSTTTFKLTGGSAGNAITTDGSGNLTFSSVLAGTVLTTSGGTGLTSYTAGDMLYYSSGTALTKLAISGTNGHFLKVSSGAPAWAALSSGEVTTALGYTPVNKAGDTMTGLLTLSGAPSSNLHAATKKYVDDVAAGLDVKNSCRVATTANLSASYSNGSSGVGATLTNSGLMQALQIDGISVQANNRVLVKNQSTAFQNGIYTVTTVGDISNNWVLTRATDFDDGGKTSGGAFTFIEEGTTNADNGFVLTTDGTITMGTTSINFTQFSGSGSITAGAGLTQSGSTIDVASTGGGSLTISADSINLTSGIATAGTYKSVTVDTYGRVTAGTNPTTLSGYGITDALSNSSTSTQSGYFGDIFLYDDSTPSHYLGITNSANLTAARTLSLNVNDADRTVSLSGNLTVSSAATISGTNTGDQTITLTGDVTGSGTGSFATTLATVATAGTYRSVTVNAKGLVTSGTNPTTFSGYGISDSSANLAAAISDETGSGSLVFGTGPTLSLPVIDNIKLGYASTATAAGTTTLTSASNYRQYFTGTTTQTLQLPVATTMVAGQGFEIHNNSTGTVTVQTSGGNSLIVLEGGKTGLVTCINPSGGTGTASWDADFTGGTNSTGTGSLVYSTSPTFTTPILGTPQSGNLSNCTNIPVNQATGTLATGNGGTGLTTFTSGGAVYATSTSALTTGTLPVTAGGTGATTLTSKGILYGNGTSAVTATAAASYDTTYSVGQLLGSDSSNNPVWTNTVDGGGY